MKHTVKDGENLTEIAKRYGVTVNDIQKANSKLIKSIHVIKVGWVLEIPCKNSDIKKQLKKALNDVENLPSVKTLIDMIGG